MNGKSPKVRIISLANQKFNASLISYEVEKLIESQIQSGKKTLLFYNRRAHSHAWICQDCGYFESCPDCDIALAYHSQPRPTLRCHQCSHVALIPESCPQCRSHFSKPIGVGIQQIEEGLQKLFPHQTIYRLDSDIPEKSQKTIENIEKSDIILSTQKGQMIRHDTIDTVVFLLFEVNFSVPMYDIEEEIYHMIAYFKKQKTNLYIQTYMPEHPILQSLTFSNYQDFLNTILIPERKSFGYPPFGEFVIFRVHHQKKEKVRAIIQNLSESIKPLLTDELFFSVDSDIWTRSQGQWNQKIILKGKGIIDIIEKITPQVVRSRFVHLEWQ
ncbi:hypothetical protein KGV55_03430 [Candidatus Gracilibacteria bacterium]|nr:hypothetical protein [Candidatus Gracilibacteria bacterium]